MELQHTTRNNHCYPGIDRGTTFGYGFATVQDHVWTLSQVLLATGGRFVSGRPDATFRAISTDTRTLEPGDLFLALSGDSFDGEDFVMDAVKKGAAGLIVSEQLHLDVPVPVVQVADTLQALGDLAAYRRAAMHNLQLIAITGSSGKTTVKEMCAAILKEEYNVLKTEGNFNNLIGMPLTLLGVDSRHDVAVIEMGMNRAGEIDRMAEIADPDVACIVNVHGAHLAGLGTIEGVAKAKEELFQSSKSWATLCVNIDDKRVRIMARRCNQKQVTFGRARKAFIRATHVRNLGEKGMVFTLNIGKEKIRIQIPSLGEHSVSNALAAAAMSHAIGVHRDQIVAGLTRFQSIDKRMQIEEVGGLKLVNDCYNSNPASMLAAFETVRGMKKDHKCMAVLGDMLELGEASCKAHRQLGETVACKEFDYLISYGEFSRKVVEGALDAGMTMKQARKVENKDDAVETILSLKSLGALNDGDYILIKGSRGMRMETIVEQLRKRL